MNGGSSQCCHHLDSVFPCQVRLVVALTTLLVLYTLFNHTSDTLPDTAYIKMIDAWFLHCISVLFVIIIVHVVVEHLDKVGQGTAVRPVITIKSNSTQRGPEVAAVSKGERLLGVFRVFIVPLELVIFNTVFWAVLVLSDK